MKGWNAALTSELGGCGAVRRGLPSVLMLFKLLHPAQVEAPVPLGDVQDEQVKHLPLLHHCQLHFGPQETLGVVAVKTGLPHVDTGDEKLVLGSLRPCWQEAPFHHWQGGVASSLGHNAGERDVLALLGHREGWRGDGDIDSQTHIWGGIVHRLFISTQQQVSTIAGVKMWCFLRLVGNVSTPHFVFVHFDCLLDAAGFWLCFNFSCLHNRLYKFLFLSRCQWVSSSLHHHYSSP